MTENQNQPQDAKSIRPSPFIAVGVPVLSASASGAVQARGTPSTFNLDDIIFGDYFSTPKEKSIFPSENPQLQQKVQQRHQQHQIRKHNQQLSRGAILSSEEAIPSQNNPRTFEYETGSATNTSIVSPLLSNVPTLQTTLAKPPSSESADYMNGRSVGKAATKTLEECNNLAMAALDTKPSLRGINVHEEIAKESTLPDHRRQNDMASGDMLEMIMKSPHIFVRDTATKDGMNDGGSMKAQKGQDPKKVHHNMVTTDWAGMKAPAETTPSQFNANIEPVKLAGVSEMVVTSATLAEKTNMHNNNSNKNTPFPAADPSLVGTLNYEAPVSKPLPPSLANDTFDTILPNSICQPTPAKDLNGEISFNWMNDGGSHKRRKIQKVKHMVTTDWAGMKASSETNSSQFNANPQEPMKLADVPEMVVASATLADKTNMHKGNNSNSNSNSNNNSNIPFPVANPSLVGTLKYEAPVSKPLPPGLANDTFDTILPNSICRPTHAEDLYEEISSKRCNVCLEPLVYRATLPVSLNACGHSFHQHCLRETMKHQCSLKCPECRVFLLSDKDRLTYLRGNMPSGSISCKKLDNASCAGFEGCGCISICYNIHSSNQQSYHPTPGQLHGSARRTAYLPDNEEGRQLLCRLQAAFLCGLTFNVGTSLTTNRDNSVTWASIHHKTSTSGGTGRHGYPDGSYLFNTNAELDTAGVPNSIICAEYVSRHGNLRPLQGVSKGAST